MEAQHLPGGTKQKKAQDSLWSGRDFKPGASNQETGALHIDHDLMFLYTGVPFIVSPGMAAFFV